jgi:hypothetical protein
MTCMYFNYYYYFISFHNRVHCHADWGIYNIYGPL